MRYILFLLIILFSGCITQKKREDITFRYLRENPKVLADLSALHYPSVPKTGIPIIIRDTVIDHLVDTIVVDSIRIVRVETIKHYTNNIHTTDTVVDNARLDAMMHAKFDAERRLLQCDAERHYEYDRSKQRLYWLIGVSIVLALLIVFNIFKLFKLSSWI